MGLGAFGSAPAMGVAQYNTGIPSGPSTPPQQMAQLKGVFSGMGMSPDQIGSYAPETGQNGQANNPQQKSVSDSQKMLLKQAGAQSGNQFANTVNQNEAQLGYNEANANSQVGNAMQGVLADQYKNNIGLQGDYNAGLVQNQIRNQLLLSNLMGSLLGQSVGGLMSGIGGLTSGAVGGALNPSIQSGSFSIG